jgi:hypothetical protein
VSIKLFLPRLTDVSYVPRVVAVVVAVVSLAEVVAVVVVVAHGQVVSPSLRVKRSHLTNFCGLQDPVYAFALMCMYDRSCMLYYFGLSDQHMDYFKIRYRKQGHLH